MTPLPKLPYTEAIRKLDCDEWVYSTDQDFANPEKYGWERVFTAAQMLAFQRETLEWAAQRCEEMARDLEEYSPNKNYDFVALECAAAIREALK